MKNVVWIGRRQVRGLIVLLALLPLIPSSFLIHTLWLNAQKDQVHVVDDMNNMFRNQLHLSVERFSTSANDAPRGEAGLIRFMTHVFGSKIPMQILTADGKEIYKSAAPFSRQGFAYRVLKGEYADYQILIDSTPEIPSHIREERRATVNQASITLFATIIIAGGVWYAINRGLRIDEIRKDLIATISHEIKTPVSAIKILAESIESGELNDSKKAEYLQLIASENSRIEKLANRFLTFGRLERGQLPMLIESISLKEVLDDTKTLLEPAFQDVGGKIEIVGEIALKVRGDQEGIETIISNLLENALKYGGVPPRVLIEVATENQGAVISISDNGTGIPKRERQAIFRQFYRSEGRLDDGQAGVGLGLAISQRIARLMNGSLRLGETTKNDFPGARFELTLPLDRKNES